MRENSFISQLRRQLDFTGESTEYWDGPWANSFGVHGIFVQELDYFFTNLKDCEHNGLVLAGYSRGGYVAACVNDAIQKATALAKAASLKGAVSNIETKKLFNLISETRQSADAIRLRWGGTEGGFTPINSFPDFTYEYIARLASTETNGLLLLDPVKRIFGNGNKLNSVPNLNATAVLHFRRSKLACSRSFFGFVEMKKATHTFYATHSAIEGLAGASMSSDLSFFARDKCMVSIRKDDIVAKQVAGTINRWMFDKLGRQTNIGSKLVVMPKTQRFKDYYTGLCGH